MRSLPSPTELHALARQGMRLYAITRDPLTASAVEMLYTHKGPITEPVEHASNMLKTQLQAYSAIHTEPLPE